MAHASPTVSRRPLHLTRRRMVLVGLAVLLLNPIALFNYAFFGSLLLGNLANQSVLDHFSQPFFETPLPAGVLEIGHDSFMQFHGAHGCSFVAQREIETSHTRAELQAYFAGIGYAMPHGEPHFTDPEGLARVQVNTVDGTMNRYVLRLNPESHYVTGWDDKRCGPM